MVDNKIKPLTIEIDQKLWERFKEITIRTKTLNDAVVELIEREVKNAKL